MIGLGFNSSAVEDVDLEALCLAFVSEVRQPGAQAPNCSDLSSIGTTQHVYVREKDWEVVIEMSRMEKSSKLNALFFARDCAGPCTFPFFFVFLGTAGG